MKEKPKISKGDDGWQVTLPAFGFGKPTVRSGFGSRDAAGNWLKRSSNLGSAQSSTDRVSTPNGCVSYGRDAFPVIIR